ncbi:phage tail tip lysozyme [Burkholderia territorii]|uniref:phage tail tip lysozyme n=1 Tax=Burkholderia territorii TaxID=1503055 RepID=UPI000A741A89|nr:phage tail tip lysozyme [Burkholderia territorii]
MATVSCGSGICIPRNEPGTIGCLVRFTDRPDKVLLMTAGHAVLATNTRQGDPVESPDMPGTVLGLLLTWTSLTGNVTADVALVWVDPALVTPEIIGIGLPKGGVTDVRAAQRVRLFSLRGIPREMRVDQASANVPLLARGPDWSAHLTYRAQIMCRPASPQMATQPGDSGAIVVDDNNRVIGMVVAAADDAAGITVVTPIFAILNHPAWRGGTLEVLDSIPRNAIAPPIAQQALAGATPGRVDLSSLNANQKVMAQKILNAFFVAGYGLYQQVAALANAKAESSLKPDAHALTASEDSVGLFQLNRVNGEGKNFSVEQLADPDFNIKVTLDVLSRFPSFRAADSLDSAVEEFVRRFERPANADAAVEARQLIAHSFYVSA